MQLTTLVSKQQQVSSPVQLQPVDFGIVRDFRDPHSRRQIQHTGRQHIQQIRHCCNRTKTKVERCERVDTVKGTPNTIQSIQPIPTNSNQFQPIPTNSNQFTPFTFFVVPVRRLPGPSFFSIFAFASAIVGSFVSRGRSFVDSDGKHRAPHVFRSAGAQNFILAVFHQC